MHGREQSLARMYRDGNPEMETTMKIEAKYLPELIASDDTTREHLCHAHLDTKAKLLVSTDGHRLVAVPVDVDANDHDGPVTADALKAARAAIRRTGLIPEIAVNGAQQVGNGGPSFPRPTLEGCSNFPPYQQVIPSYDERAPNVSVITFNAAYLAEMAKAMGAGKSAIVTLVFEGPLDPIRVIAGSGSEAIGVLMPARR
jgi:DNA polymerase III sliding clamp (beta) subunit (PCNA family)